MCASQIGGGTGLLRYEFTPDLQLDLRGYYTQARTDFDGFDTPTGNFGDDNEYGMNDQILGYAGLTLHSPDRTLTNRIAFQYTYTNTRNYDPDAPANYGSPTTETFYGIGTNQREEYQGTWKLTPGVQAVFGAQHERSTIDTLSPEFPPVPPPLVNAATIDSGYAQLQAQVAAGLTLTAGERYDHHSVYGGHEDSQLAAAWVLNDSHTILRASFGQGFKAPSLYQLYSDYGNPALRPELAQSWDAGIERHAWNGRLQLSATYFQTNSRDLIEFFDCTMPAGLCATDPYGYYANIARALARGAELQAAFNATAQLSLALNYTYTYTADRSPGSPTYGQELLRRPEDAANASATYRWSSKWSANLACAMPGRAMMIRTRVARSSSAATCSSTCAPRTSCATGSNSMPASRMLPAGATRRRTSTARSVGSPMRVCARRSERTRLGLARGASILRTAAVVVLFFTTL